MILDSFDIRADITIVGKLISACQVPISRNACRITVKMLFSREYCNFQRQNTLVATFR